MTADEAAAEIHRLGYGVTANLWRDEADCAVLAWRDNHLSPPVAAANGKTLTEALVSLLAKVEAL